MSKFYRFLPPKSAFAKIRYTALKETSNVVAVIIQFTAVSLIMMCMSQPMENQIELKEAEI